MKKACPLVGQTPSPVVGDLFAAFSAIVLQLFHSTKGLFGCQSVFIENGNSLSVVN